MAWLVALALPSATRAATYNAGDACTEAGALHGKNDANGFYYLVCDGAQWQGLLAYMAANQYVGVGTPTPAAALHVDGEAIIGYTGLTCDGTTQGGIRYDSSGNAISYCNGTSWTDFGGITAVTGEPDPTLNYLLNDLTDVTAGSPSGGECLTYNGSAWVNGVCGSGVTTVTGEPDPALNFVLDDISDVSAASPNSADVLTYNGSNWVAQAASSGLWTAGSGDDIYYNSGTPQVGIGIAAPVAALHIVASDGYDGLIRLRNTHNHGISGLTLYDDSGAFKGNIGHFNFAYDGVTDPLAIVANDNDIVLVTGDTGSVPGTVRMLVDAATGNVGIGTDTPLETLYVVGNISYTGMITDISDRRMKTDIAALPPGQLEKIRALKSVSFRMKNDPKGQTELGLIAQDVQNVYPEVVYPLSDGTLSLNYTGLIGPLIEAVQELAEQNEALRAEVELLKSQHKEPEPNPYND
jgi:hypothetical protein